MNLAYIRVSTVEQNDGRQRAALEQHSVEKWFCEKISAKDANRPQLQALLNFAREDDCIYVHDFSRLARSVKDLLEIVEQLNAKHVHLISLKENLDTSTSTGRLMLTMIAAINEFERANLLERQREGIALAVQEKKYKGRKAVHIDDFDAHYQRYMRREVTKTQLAKELNISRPTLDKLIKAHKSTAKAQG